MHHLLPLLSLLALTSASPKERLKVKYRVKPGHNPVKVAVNAVPLKEEVNAARLKVESPLLGEDTLQLLNEVDGDALVLEAKELLLSSTPASYRNTVTSFMGQLERAARSEDV